MRLHITILIFILLTNLTFGQSDNKKLKQRKKDNTEYYSKPILEKIIVLDSARIEILIDKALTSTEIDKVILRFAKLNDIYKGYLIDNKSKIYQFDTIKVDLINKMIELEKNCINKDWDCFGGFDGIITTYVEIQVNNDKSKFKYCNRDLKGFDEIIDRLICKN